MRTLTVWEFNDKLGRLQLPQNQHLEDCINFCQESVSLIQPFAPWQKYCDVDLGGLRLYAHDQWTHINDIVAIIDSQVCMWVYAALNRYLLICDPDPTADDDYDMAIFHYLDKCLKNYTIVDYKYQTNNSRGNIGNFLVPDNRILCKKILSD